MQQYVSDALCRRRQLCLMLLVVLAISPVWRPVVAAQTVLAWHDTGINLPGERYGPLCFDATQANFILLPEPAGTVAYNWRTGERKVVSPLRFERCGPAGLLYAWDAARGLAYRFSLADPSERTGTYMPTHVAEDGSLQVYSIGYTGRDVNRLLWASSDGGLTWQERGQQFAIGTKRQILLSQADARAIYMLVAEPLPQPQGRYRYSIHFSSDAGENWQQRWEQSVDRQSVEPSFGLERIPGPTPVDMLVLTISYGGGSSGLTQVHLSSDGARTFRLIGQRGLINQAMNGGYVQLVHTDAALLRLTWNTDAPPLSASTDGGRSWQPRALPNPNDPPQPGPPNIFTTLTVAAAVPRNVFMRDSRDRLWYSADAGMSWRAFENKADVSSYTIDISPYLPLEVLGVENTRLYTLALPDGGMSMTAGVAPNGAPGGTYFPQTRHNLHPLFKPYWTAAGGLAQFGYPQTEPFRELNPSDGRVYLVQYFERNRFEYHPELKGTPYEVLLGLLGNQLTAVRRTQGEPPFNRVANPNLPNVTYFDVTGHTLRLGFKQYWEAHGGLAVYGYPISEEFAERNPDDGTTYTVQYFERARFEFHPEYRGTPYEVLLGLLGNALLREKGWQ